MNKRKLQRLLAFRRKVDVLGSRILYVGGYPGDNPNVKQHLSLAFQAMERAVEAINDELEQAGHDDPWAL